MRATTAEPRGRALAPGHSRCTFTASLAQLGAAPHVESFKSLLQFHSFTTSVSRRSLCSASTRPTDFRISFEELNTFRNNNPIFPGFRMGTGSFTFVSLK